MLGGHDGRSNVVLQGSLRRHGANRGDHCRPEQVGRLFGAEPAADLLRTTVVAAIGPVTAEAALQFNIPSTIVPADHTTAALARAIVEYFSRAQS